MLTSWHHHHHPRPGSHHLPPRLLHQPPDCSPSLPLLLSNPFCTLQQAKHNSVLVSLYPSIMQIYPWLLNIFRIKMAFLTWLTSFRMTQPCPTFPLLISPWKSLHPQSRGLELPSRLPQTKLFPALGLCICYLPASSHPVFTRLTPACPTCSSHLHPRQKTSPYSANPRGLRWGLLPHAPGTLCVIMI